MSIAQQQAAGIFLSGIAMLVCIAIWIVRAREASGGAAGPQGAGRARYGAASPARCALRVPIAPHPLGARLPARRQRRDENAGIPAEAQSRARALLLAHLSPAQRQQYESRRCFSVRAASGNVYWLYHARSMNVVRHGVGAFCIQPADPLLPVEDVLLAQKALIESDEPRFLKVANRSG